MNKAADEFSTDYLPPDHARTIALLSGFAGLCLGIALTIVAYSLGRLL